MLPYPVPIQFKGQDQSIADVKRQIDAEPDLSSA
jgi:hypothetical protein